MLILIPARLWRINLMMSKYRFYWIKVFGVNIGSHYRDPDCISQNVLAHNAGSLRWRVPMSKNEMLDISILSAVKREVFEACYVTFILTWLGIRKPIASKKSLPSGPLNMFFIRCHHPKIPNLVSAHGELGLSNRFAVRRKRYSATTLMGPSLKLKGKPR